MGDTSKANPFKLSSYASDGMELVGDLKTKSADVKSSIDSLNGSGSPYLSSLGGSDGFTDLVGDWYHLDEFAGDVANGFIKATGLGEQPLTPEQMEDMVLEVGDGSILDQGQVGYADRDEAIQAAEDMAEQLGQLKENGASPEEIQDFVHMADRGQYDSAFAVTFSEEVGVEGYADATALIRMAYSDEGLVPEEGLAAVQILATTLTTALDTRKGIENVDLHDLDNEDRPDDLRISEDFINDLTGGYQPDAYADSNSEPTDLDLSVLLRYTDPPTDVAVDIANNRMTPTIASNYQWDSSVTDPGGWGDNAGLVTNYATMLGRNDDASALWLDSGDNIELVLARESGYDIDGGLALSNVVENGVTHWDDELRQPVMERAMDAIGGEQDEIRNPNMYDALTSGVESNMDLIADRATQYGMQDGGVTADNVRDTHDFLRELMGDDESAARIYSSTLDYAHDQLDVTGEESLSDEARNIGGVFSIVTEADVNAEIGSAEERAARRDAFIDGANTVTSSLIGLIPGGGTATTLATDGLGWGSEQLLDQFRDTDSVSNAYEDAADYRRATQASIESMFAVHEYATGDITTEQVLEQAEESGTGDTDFFVDDTDGDKRPIKPISEMSDSEKEAFYDWIGSEEMRDKTGSIVTEAGQSADDIRVLVEDRT